jgi:hypothetical protein
MKIFHHDIELTYENRKKFAESYTGSSPQMTPNNKEIEY